MTMRRTSWIVAAASLCGLTVHPLPASADTAAAASVGQQIQKMYNKRDAALNHFDIEGYLAAYNANYLNVTSGSQLKKVDQKRNALITQLQHAQKLSRHDTVQSVILYSDGATVTVATVTTAIIGDPKSGQARTVTLHQSNRAFWVHTKMGWRIKQERTLSSAA